MSCEICGRSSCTRSFHSLEAQRLFDQAEEWPVLSEDEEDEDANQTTDEEEDDV